VLPNDVLRQKALHRLLLSFFRATELYEFVVGHYADLIPQWDHDLGHFTTAWTT
jgi:hypothetical protein